MKLTKINIALGIILSLLMAGASSCKSAFAHQFIAQYVSRPGPQDLLSKYFNSAIKQDYATTYDCYYDAYKAKVTKEEYVKHRKEASVLQSYQITSLVQNVDTAQATVVLTFAPSEKLKRAQPVSTSVKEDLVRQNKDWKIKVW